MDENAILDAVGQWLGVFALIGIGSVLWVFFNAEKRSAFLKEGKFDLRAFWRAYLGTFGTGVIAFVVILAAIIGALAGAALLR